MPPRQALPGMLEGALPGLEGLAQHATQYVTALLPHNRRRALERLRDGSGDLARQLALSADRASRLLVDVPARWQEVAAAELAEMGRRSVTRGTCTTRSSSDSPSRRRTRTCS